MLRTLLENGSRERAQYLIDKMWWRSWRLFLALSGTAMEYLAPVSARTRSFKEFMTEWVTEQFMKNLAEFDLEKPWFWDLFMEESTTRTTASSSACTPTGPPCGSTSPCPTPTEREWLNAKYPRWEQTYGALWDQLERRWEASEANTLSYGLPALCNLCQLPALSPPGRNTACTLKMGGAATCSAPSRAAGSSSRRARGSRITTA